VYQQAVRIMHFQTEIRYEPRFIFSEQKHARQSSQTELFAFLPDEQTRLDIHECNLSRLKHKMECARHAGAVEQTIKLHLVSIIKRLLKPKLGKPRKFLAARFARIDGQAPR